ncbi:MAG: hypothetical protein ACLUHA_13995 [Bacteroides stercoris]
MDATDGVIGQSVRRSRILHMYLDGSIPLQIHYCNKARNQKGIKILLPQALCFMFLISFDVVTAKVMIFSVP